MTRTQRILTLAVIAATTAGVFVPGMIRAATPTPPAIQAAQAIPPAGELPARQRSREQILKELNAVSEDIQKTMPSLASVGDEAFRKGDGQKIVAPMKKFTDLLAEYAATIPDPDDRKSVLSDRWRFLGLLAVLGDTDSTKSLEAAAGGKGDDAVSAKAALMLGQWLTNSKDAAAQGKLVDEFTVIAKANADNDEVAETLMFMANTGAANDELSKKAVAVIRDNLKGRAASQLVAQADAMQAQKDLLNKPLTLLGRTSTGSKFTSADYKGKVVLVDFWATWCGPCIAGLPEVKQVYKDYHDKGLEIVGVSCDSNDEVLNSFIKENGMTWMQLREDTQNSAEQWHPLAKKYGVEGIPTMFLIDKQGVLRFVDARGHLEDGVKKLLAEDDKSATTKPADPK